MRVMRRDSRNTSKVIRNITIVCGCLVAIVLYFERGILLSSSLSPGASPVVTSPSGIIHIAGSKIIKDPDDEDTYIPIDDEEELYESEGDTPTHGDTNAQESKDLLQSEDSESLDSESLDSKSLDSESIPTSTSADVATSSIDTKPGSLPTMDLDSTSTNPLDDESNESHDHEDDEKLIPPNTTPTPRPLTQEEADKLKRKQLEEDEKVKLEAKVLKEYEDEISGKTKDIAPVKNPDNPFVIPKPLLFLHVPKTAGSTLAQVFKNNEKPDKYYHFWSQPRVKELPIVPQKDTIFGHFRYGLHFYLENRTATYATMLREPVDRVISYYHFHLQDPQDPAHKFAIEHTFEEWLEASPAAHNEITKCLSGIRSEFYPSNHSFEMAKHHLSKMGYVGITERFDESLFLMKYYLGFNDTSYGSTKVGMKKPKEVSPEVIDRIKQKNWMDIILYDMAKERFEQELEEVGKYLIKQEAKNH